MRRRKIDSSRERRAVISMITSKKYLSKATRIIDPDLLEAPCLKLVAGWCLEYWKQYKKAPGEDIENIYHAWSEGAQDTALREETHDFLDSLSKEYEKAKDPQNVAYLTNELRDLMDVKRLQLLKDDLEFHLLKNDVQKAQRSVTRFRTARAGDQGHSEEPSPSSPRLWSFVYADLPEPVIRFSGDAGRFFNAATVPEGLIALQAPEKTGKTFWLLEFAFQALRQRKKVAVFHVGDLSYQQYFQRLGVRLSTRPMWPDQIKGVQYPDEILFTEDQKQGGYQIKTSRMKFDRVADEHSSKQGWRRFCRAHGLSMKHDYLMVNSYPTATVNVGDLSSQLDEWKMDRGFIPDVIIIDYADILAPEDTGRRHEHDRNVINDTWKAMRRLAQSRKALVLTATQANAKAYQQRIQGMGSFSEDKRKLAHVTGLLGLNQTAKEKEMGGMRLNWLVLRESPYNINRPLYVATCFPLGRAMVMASLRKRKAPPDNK